MIALSPAIGLFLQAQVVIDNFESVAAWKAVPSDDVSLSITQDAGISGKSMRLDFDFHGHGGYAVARRNVNLALPANYEFSFSIRGDAPVNTLELKLVDPSGDNVWWSNQPGFLFPSQWRQITRKKRHISFAWGPLGGGEMKTVAGIEIAITAGSGGKGTVWIDDLMLTPLEPQVPYNLDPKFSVGGGPAQRWLDIDFQKRREFGGLTVEMSGSAYTVSTSLDGNVFRQAAPPAQKLGARSYFYMPETDARYVRLTFNERPQLKDAPPYIRGLTNILVQPLEWSASMNAFFAAVARDAPPGNYPRYFSDRQSYWTVIGVNGDSREALIDAQGRVESGKAQFSIEPFLAVDGRLVTWHDASTSTGFAGSDVPIPFVRWKAPRIELITTAFAAGPPESSVLYARYRVRNSGVSRRAKLYVAIRPFQVNPPWQFLNTPGGFASIDSISYDGHLVRVNADREVIPLTAASAFKAMSSDAPNMVELLRQDAAGMTEAFQSVASESATNVIDAHGAASGVLAWNLQLRADADTTIDIAIPLHAGRPPCPGYATSGKCGRNWTSSQLAATEATWRGKLGRVGLTLPLSASHVVSTIRANLAYILINRDGPAIQPGSRSYERSWIRDGALTATALLRLGHYAEVKEFVEWYARFQFDNGKIPCCVDSRGADPVPENDSHGEFIYLVAEYFRHTGDRELLERLWPNVSRAVAFMDSLRLSRTTEEYRTGDKRVFYGLMPQSISHEGYSAKPMHSYWDDFFALRGFKDAAEIASILGKPEARRYAEARDTFRKDFYASIGLAMAQHRIDFIPGAAELGDFDATSTTIAVSPVDELAHISQPALKRTFDKYYENFRARAATDSWDGYTPYEWRVVGTFVRLGNKHRAHEVANWFFRHQRPTEWRHWAEVVFRDSLKPAFIGDMPHTWVGSDFIRSTLDMFAYERESDSSLVIGAGIPESWVREDEGVRIERLSTHYGPLSYEMRGLGQAVELRIEAGTRIPRGGLVVRSPFDRAPRSVRLNGVAARPATEVVVRSLPAVVSFSH